MTTALACALAAIALAGAAGDGGPASRAAAARPAVALPAVALPMAARATQARPGGAAGHGGPPPAARAGRTAAAPCPVPPRGPLSDAPGAGKTVALTFDDGPGRSTGAILAILERYRVPATFFNIGADAAIAPAMVRAEARAGFVVEDHTWDHPHMRALPAAAQAAEISRTAALQRRLIGAAPCLFRPPYGEYSQVTVTVARQQRMAVWLWSVDTQDWMAAGSPAPFWVQRVIGRAEAGGAFQHPVVLMHNQVAGNPATVAALPVIIRFYQSRGYHFVAL
jgi:peptidoglycan/xylan/chitin deacetylase (PgdA/CDA1 family)